MTVTHRIPKPLAGTLLAFAGIADLLQMLLTFLWFTIVLGIVAYAIGLLVSLLIYGVFSMVFIGRGVQPFSGTAVMKKTATFAISLGLKAVPIIGEFVPSLTIWTLAIIWQSWAEDVINAKKKAAEDVRIKRTREIARRMRRERRERLTANDNFSAANDTDSRRNNSGRYAA